MSSVEHYGREIAQGLGDFGMQLALAVTDVVWLDAARDAIEKLAASGAEFTADDVVHEVGAPDSPGAMGALFRGTAQERLIQPVGYTTSRRIGRHGSVVRVWRGVSDVLAP